ncbi:helix-turn-helix transcriptional regulator [Trinickia acidisoli]|uniref:helix-turn-helix transcriptional regulator n=1 Tax=Trinickia acidisoli TaxID=2767482 RepID=UPI001A8E0D62|nr:AlpA family phage regulatory protein [Trinickia acidisoli]
MAKQTTTAQPSGGAHSSPKSLPLDGYTRWNDLRNLVPGSREWVRLREKEGRFPKRVRLSQRCSAWPNRELHRWFADPAGYRAESV